LEDLESDEMLRDKMLTFYEDCVYEDEDHPVVHFKIAAHVPSESRNAVKSRICSITNTMRDEGDVERIPMACTFTFDE
jgi:hypothetical protein